MYQAGNKLDLTLNKQYQLFLDIEGFETHGITLSKVFSAYKDDFLEVNIGLGMELLYGMEAQDGTIFGKAITSSKKNYDVSLVANYLYIKNYLYDLDVIPVASYGYSSHIAIQTKMHDFSFTCILNDILGKLNWNGLPFSIVNLASGNKSYDKDGYVKYAPIISGKEGTRSYTQNLPKKWNVHMDYHLNTSQFTLGSEYIEDIHLPYIGYSYQYAKQTKMMATYESYFGMFGVEINYKTYMIQIKTNSLSEPSAAQISLGYQYYF